MPIQRFLQRLVWACVLPVFVLAIALALRGLHQQYVDDLAAAERSASNLLLSIDARLQSQLESLEVLARTFTGTDPAALATHFRQVQAFQAAFASHVILADVQRRMLYNTRVPLGTALPDLPQPREASAVEAAIASGRPTVGALVYGPVAREALVPIFVPVVREGRTVALLLSTLEARELQALLDRAHLPSFLGLSLLDANGDPIAARRPGRPAEAASRAGLDREASSTLRSQVGPWSLATTLDRPALGTELMRTGLLLAAALAATSAGVVWAAHRASLRLAQAVPSLATGLA
ncbi:MAG: cache domain-containing protein [Rubrivivax sp.]